MLSIYHLPNKLPNEKIVKIVRRDIFILIRKIVLFLVLIFLPLIVYFLVIAPQTQTTEGVMFYPLLILGSSTYYLFIWLFFFFSFIDYYLDVWIITSERIIDIEQRGFFSRVISEHKLFRIQDVTSEVHGFWQTLIHFGDVHVQTAGTKQRFHFDEIPYPEKVRDIIIKLVEKKKQEIRQEMKEDAKG